MCESAPFRRNFANFSRRSIKIESTRHAHGSRKACYDGLCLIEDLHSSP